jgi:methyl-accepting chemotaxis protein
MKNNKLRIAIVIPSLAVLIVGIAIMVTAVGLISSNTAMDLTNDLMDARVQQFTNEFRVFSEDVYGALRTTVRIVANYIDPVFASDVSDPRGEVIGILADVLLANDKLVGTWTCWEPNAFDGKDSDFAYAPFHDGTGRFVPYVFRDGSKYDIEALVDYDDPVDGEYYQGPRKSGKPYVTEPYNYDLGSGRTIQIFSIAIPIMQNGSVVGVVGVDIDLQDITAVMNSGSILADGYLATLSPGGLITTHSNKNMIMAHYDTIWMRNYSAQVESVLRNGGGFRLSAYSDVSKTNIAFLGQGVMVGDTGRYWLICGVVPETTVNASSTSLLWTIIAIGAALVVVVGVTIFIIIRKSLVKLPALTAAAEAISLGDVESRGFDSGTAETKNEITLLERAFVKMATGIKEHAEVMAQIAQGDYSVSVDDRSDKDIMNQATSKMLDNTNTTLNQISVSASQVYSGAKRVNPGAVRFNSRYSAKNEEKCGNSRTDRKAFGNDQRKRRKRQSANG